MWRAIWFLLAVAASATPKSGVMAAIQTMVVSEVRNSTPADPTRLTSAPTMCSWTLLFLDKHKTAQIAPLSPAHRNQPPEISMRI